MDSGQRKSSTSQHKAAGERSKPLRITGIISHLTPVIDNYKRMEVGTGMWGEIQLFAGTRCRWDMINAGYQLNSRSELKDLGHLYASYPRPLLLG